MSHAYCLDLLVFLQTDNDDIKDDKDIKWCRLQIYFLIGKLLLVYFYSDRIRRWTANKLKQQIQDYQYITDRRSYCLKKQTERPRVAQRLKEQLKYFEEIINIFNIIKLNTYVQTPHKRKTLYSFSHIIRWQRMDMNSLPRGSS